MAATFAPSRSSSVDYTCTQPIAVTAINSSSLLQLRSLPRSRDAGTVNRCPRRFFLRLNRLRQRARGWPLRAGPRRSPPGENTPPHPAHSSRDYVARKPSPLLAERVSGRAALVRTQLDHAARLIEVRDDHRMNHAPDPFVLLVFLCSSFAPSLTWPMP